ncbi:MAG: glycoside hydrolase family 2 protein [Bryobacteraceae bacterium]
MVARRLKCNTDKNALAHDRVCATLILVPVLIACAFAQQTPRPEFPEPQFEREQWQNLNGRWDFDFDDANTGRDEHWEDGQHKFARNILVPFCFESRLSGIADTGFHPNIWYRRTFSVPDAWRGKRIQLHFGAVNYWSQVWVNGQAAGRHEGGHVPFSYDVTSLLKPGSNTLVVRSVTRPTDRSIPRGKQYWEPKSKGIFYTRTSGIWQTVWLEPLAATSLQSARITPDAEGVAAISAQIRSPQPGVMLRTTLAFGGQTEAVSIVRADDPRVSTTVSVTRPKLWSPASPNLYDVTFELLQAERVIDRVKSYTGFRSVGVEDGRVTLNGRPIFIKMILDQGYWPESILTPPTDGAIQYDIRLTKEMGFNGSRKHQKLEDPRFLYWADKMGLLVSSEMANAYLFDDAAVERFTREWMAAMDRDYNHPSIIIWVPINESWGVPNLRDSRQQNYLRELYALSHSIDNTRLVVDNDGWEHTDMTDLFNIHDYARTGALLYERYKDLGKPGAGVPNNSRAALAPGFRYNGTPVLLSEFGGVAFIPEGHQVPAESWGYSGVEKSQDAVLERLRGLYTAISRVPGFAGLCYTQLTDVEQEINGLLTYDRKPKFPAATLREINSLIRIGQ